MKTYRLKTRDEFESEFGGNWRKNVHWTLDERMDYLFGDKLNIYQAHAAAVWDFRLPDFRLSGCWIIHKHMLVQIDSASSSSTPDQTNVDYFNQPFLQV